MRECGLKSTLYAIAANESSSLPVRECGLKYRICIIVNRFCWVTPCAGVWIEITVEQEPDNEFKVTPCAGVWIEILNVML